MANTSDEQPQMGIWEHVEELRGRLLKALIALVVGVLAGFAITERVIFWLARPIGGLENLQSIEVTENIGVFMRVSLLGGFILAFPIIFYQLMAFVLPGLEKNERRWLLLSIPFATVMFVAGVLFAYWVMLPAAIPFLTEFLGIHTVVRLSNYVNFVTNLMFWIGLSFEAPLVMFILAKFHIVNARMLARQWRVAIVVIAVIAAMVTPTVDPVNMGLLMLPLFILYLLSVLLAMLAR